MNPGPGAAGGRLAALCGEDDRWRLAGVVGLGVAVAVVLASVWLPEWLVDAAETHGGVQSLDALVTVGVLIVVLAEAVGLLYGLWNGGPLLAASFPLAPELAGRLATGGWGLDADLTLALCAGAAAAALGLYGAGRRRPEARCSGPLDGLTVATSLIVTGLAALIAVGDAAGPHVAGAVRLSWLLWSGAAVIVLAGWVGYVRVGSGDRVVAVDLPDPPP